MFETVVPELSVKPNRRLLYESLPFSIAIHAAGIVSLGVAALSHITFPLQPPKLIVPYLLLAQAAAAPPPPPPATAPHPAAPKPPGDTAPTPVLPTANPQLQQFAPQEIPDTIPTPEEIAASIPMPGAGAAPAGDGGETGAIAVPGGVEGGVAGGVKKGILGGVLLEDGRLHFDRDALLPMTSMRYVHPIFPEMERINHIEGDVVVRYVIGKDGAVTSATVISSSNVKAFDRSAIDAISRWRFHPLKYGDDVLEVVHEVVVRFRLEAQ